MSASPEQNFEHGKDKPGESTGMLCYVPCKASNRDNKANVCPFKKGLLSPTDRKDTDQLNPCEES